MKLLRPVRARRDYDDSGSVLVLVIGSTIMVALLLTVAVTFAVSQLKPSGTDQQGKAATAAAQAGIADYTARLNASPGYWDLLPTDADYKSNSAFTTGRVIPGTASTSATSYTYAVLTTSAQTKATGVVRLQATGKSGSVTKTLTAAIQSRGFLQYLYQTDKEDLDPALIASHPTDCATYWYSGRSSATDCSEIGFAAGDVITGPLHTNDTILLNGAATFDNTKTETSWPAAQTSSTTWRTAGGATITPQGTRPYYAPVVQIPATNSSLATVAKQSDVSGCVYTGATSITFAGTSMKVLSPNTGYDAKCYPFSGSATAGATVSSLPKLIYVKALDQSGGASCAKADSTTSGIGYPSSGEYVGSGNARTSGDFDGPVYACGDGTAYVQGTLDGQTTVATATDIVITGNLQYADTSTSSDDVLGLIPTGFAWVYHPVQQVCTTHDDGHGHSSTDCRYDELLPSSKSVHTVDAAILAVSDSFIVENWNLGDGLSTAGDTGTYLNVQGTIAQNFRGPVGTGSSTTGYLKNYTYDSRFEDGLQPPYFLQPIAQQWKPIQVSAG